MPLKTCASLMGRLMTAALLLGWIAWRADGSVRIPCAVAASLAACALVWIHRRFWRCPACTHRLGAAVGRYCTWCGGRLRR